MRAFVYLCLRRLEGHIKCFPHYFLINLIMCVVCGCSGTVHMWQSGDDLWDRNWFSPSVSFEAKFPLFLWLTLCTECRLTLGLPDDSLYPTSHLSLGVLGSQMGASTSCGLWNKTEAVRLAWQVLHGLP